MIKKYFLPRAGAFFFLAGLFLLLPPPTAAQSSSPVFNAGFASGLRYSANPLFTTDKVIRIYFTLQNQSAADIVGTVRVFDNDSAIGDIPFLIVGDRLVELWTDWAATPGSHALKAIIVEAKKSEIGQPNTAIILSAPSSSLDIQTIPTPTALKNNPPGDDAPLRSRDQSDYKKMSVSTTLETSTSSVIGILSQTIEQLIAIARNHTFSLSSASSTGLAAENISASTPGFSSQIERLVAAFTATLQAKKQAIQTHQADGQPGQPILTEQIKALEDKTFIKIPDNKKPTKELLVSWALSLTIAILNTWWLMALIFLVILRALWKLWKMVKNNKDE